MKNIIITGTSRGIGLHYVTFAKEGHNVLAISRTIPEQFLSNKNINLSICRFYLRSRFGKVQGFFKQNGKSRCCNS
jgi:nucleoside-diphosphate-sugar epimerase